jgi:hypothetical protein
LSAAVADAHAELARYNEAVGQGRAVDLAKPSESSCGWCPYVLDCPAVWVDPAPDLGELAVVEGDVKTVQVLASTLALTLEDAEGRITVTGVPTTDVSGRRPTPGDRIRLAGLRQISSSQMRCHPGRARLAVL